MAVTWKVKNKQILDDMIKKNESEIKKLEHHLKAFFNTEDEERKTQTRIHTLQLENERLEKIIPSELSPSQIINLTRSFLPVKEEHSKKKLGSLIKIPFVDKTAPANSKNRQAIWRFVGNEWEYDRCE